MNRLFFLLFCLPWGISLLPGDEFRVYAGSDKPSRDLMRRLPDLKRDPRFAKATWKILQKPGDEKTGDLSFDEAAIRDGIRYLPTIVLSDERGPYAKVIGAVATQEGKTFEERLSSAMNGKRANRSLWDLRRQAGLYAARLYNLLHRALLIPMDDASAIKSFLEETRELISEEATETSLRQSLLLRVVYPMQLRLYILAYDGAHTPESERHFLEAIATLEQIRDIDPRTESGREAHRLREEMRRERLRASKYD